MAESKLLFFVWQLIVLQGLCRHNSISLTITFLTICSFQWPRVQGCVWLASMYSCEPDGWHLPILLNKDPELSQQNASSGLRALPWNINFLFRYQRQGDTTQIISMPLQIFMCTMGSSLVNGMSYLRDWIGRNTCLLSAVAHCSIHFSSLVFALLWLHSHVCTSQLNRARAWIWALVVACPWHFMPA